MSNFEDNTDSTERPADATTGKNQDGNTPDDGQCGADTGPCNPPTAEYSIAKVATSESNTGIGGDATRSFPVDALPDALRAYVTQVSKMRDVPIGLVAPSVLTAVSASLGGGLQIQTWDEKVSLGNLYWIGIAPSGLGKGLVCDEVFAPAYAAEKLVFEDWQENKLPQLRAAETMLKEQIKTIRKDAAKGSRDRVEAFTEIAELERQLDAAARLKAEPRLVCEDVTREKLGELLAAQPGEALASISSEARGILDVLTRMKAEDIYTKAWSGESFRLDRRSTKNVRLNRPALTVCWMIQHDKWIDLLDNESFVTSGMLPRFLVSAPEVRLEPLPTSRRRFDPKLRHGYQALHMDLLKCYRHNKQHPATVKTNESIVAIFADYENKVRAERNPGGLLQDIGSFAARWTQNAFRIALVLHAGQHGGAAHFQVLETETAQASLAIMDWFRNEQMHLLRERMSQAELKRADRLENAIRLYGKAPATIRDLVTRNGFKEAEILRLAERRPERFKIVEHRPEKGSKGGRPSRAVELVQKIEKTRPFPDLVGGIAGFRGFAGEGAAA